MDDIKSKEYQEKLTKYIHEIGDVIAKDIDIKKASEDKAYAMAAYSCLLAETARLAVLYQVPLHKIVSDACEMGVLTYQETALAYLDREKTKDFTPPLANPSGIIN